MIAIEITVSSALKEVLEAVPKTLFSEGLADVLSYDVYEFSGFGICAISLLCYLWNRDWDRVSVTEYRRFGSPRETSVVVNGDGLPVGGGVDTRGVGVRIQRR
ncbi:hypothetical protein [Haloterrigena alkaliphila]|uniref:hypothetical protein n=1 Tax=Haloterrigena alkaliphila TaxID=2816475 RepID=UPI001CFFE17C|nr:hypothetical protein [Haloterrigena alkaliphila]UHQ95383.1 hypothetical protein J0X25_20415 [Haloterrigena alkaliphila]